MTVGQLRAVITKYYAGADFSGTDVILDALNQAKLEAQQRLDFFLGYQMCYGVMSTDGTPTALSVFTQADGSTPVMGTINSIRNTWMLFNGYLCPIDLVSQETVQTRQRRLGDTWILPRYPADSDVTNMRYEACVFRSAGGMNLYPFKAFTNTVTLVLDANVWLPDYTADGNRDFISDNCANYLKWSAISELNPIFKEFVGRQEGNVLDTSIDARAAKAWDAVERWNAGIDAYNPVTR